MHAWVSLTTVERLNLRHHPDLLNCICKIPKEILCIFKSEKTWVRRFNSGVQGDKCLYLDKHDAQSSLCNVSKRGVRICPLLKLCHFGIRIALSRGKLKINRYRNSSLFSPCLPKSSHTIAFEEGAHFPY